MQTSRLSSALEADLYRLFTLLNPGSCAEEHFIRTSRCGTGREGNHHEVRRW